MLRGKITWIFDGETEIGLIFLRKQLILFGKAHIIFLLLQFLEYKGIFMEEYMSIQQAAEKWGISERRIQVLCGEERVPGAFRIGRVWVIPSDAQKPMDARIKSGKYIKRKDGVESDH